MTDAPSSGEISETATRCVECLEEIPGEATKCALCGASQRQASVGTRLLKLMSILLTLATLALGIRQLGALAVDRLRAGEDLERKLQVVEALLAQREYPAAWKVLAATADASATQVMRERVASTWLLNASTIASNMSLGELAKELTPAIAALLGSGSSSEQADRQSLLAFAQYLRSRDEPIAGDIAGLYRKALEYDQDCTLGHILLGHYLVSHRIDVAAGIGHLDRAQELEREGRVTHVGAHAWKLTALRNLSGSVRRAPSRAIDSSSDWWQTRLTILAAANQLRLSGQSLLRRVDPGPMGPDRSTDLVESVVGIYGAAREEGGAELLRATLPDEEHLELIEWLRGQRGEDADAEFLQLTAVAQGGASKGSPATFRVGTAETAPTPSSIALSFVRATLLASMNERDRALTALRSVKPDYSWKQRFDELHTELTGEPWGDLADRDPWAYRAQVLGRGPGESEADSQEYDAAVAAIEDYMWSHRAGRRVEIDEAVAAVRAARASLANDSDRSDAEDLRWQYELYLAELLFVQGGLQEAQRLLGTLTAKLPGGHPLRARALIEEAALRASTASSSETKSDDDMAHSTAVSLLESAVEQEGWADWAWIRWRSPFSPLHGRSDYAAFLARHGRKVGGPAGIDWHYDDE